MGQPLRIEDPDAILFITLRTVGSRLWFINNPKLHYLICVFLARYQELFGVELYGFIIMGNHIHLIARFPRANKARFMQAFGSIIAKLVATHVPNFSGGRLWARRYSESVLGDPDALRRKLLYLAINPITSGLVVRLSDYTGYNSIDDSVNGTVRTFRYFAHSAFEEAKRRGHNPVRADFTCTHTLKYSRLPEYATLPSFEYQKEMKAELRAARRDAIRSRRDEDRGFAGPAVLEKQRPGAVPTRTKTSTRDSYYPLVICDCPVARQEWLTWYFSVRDDYLHASERYRSGDLNVEFPTGTYRPPSLIPIPPSVH